MSPSSCASDQSSYASWLRSIQHEFFHGCFDVRINFQHIGQLRDFQQSLEARSDTSETNTFAHGPQHLYRIYPEKVVTPEGKLLARIRSTPKMPWGEVVPVEDK